MFPSRRVHRTLRVSSKGGHTVSLFNFMKKYLLLFLLALGLVALAPQKAKADGYFGISVGPAYCEPHPVYYGGYYPHYYYNDNPYGYGYWRHHRHWRHWHDDDDD